ncbi:TetR/AcrR family transcriptional regulator [Xanthomonas tesorieronis]|uniref:TetR/AcrR family transcriptional regulator n=1 Tax=Xanthomonas tesorieronis TaxID=3160839 RepID=UPI0035126E49
MAADVATSLSMTDSPTSAKRPRGRPAQPEAEVRARLLQHAMQLLLEHGYEATTMEAVAARAGVAKKTVYRHAANREALVGLAVRAWSDGIAVPMQRDAGDRSELSPLLRAILQSLCDQVLSEPAVKLFRLLTTDFPGKPELLGSYQANGIERGRALLADWLSRQQRRGLLRDGDPAMLATLILAMAVAEPLRQMALGVTAPLPEGSVAAHLDACMVLLQGRLVP